MKHLFKKKYQGKKVLVTGHTGFKGAWLTLWLLELGAEVTGYSLQPPSDPNVFEALGLSKKIRHIYGDIRDYKKLTEVINKNRPEIVFHLAAQALVGQSYSNVRYTYQTNVIGTLNLLEAARHSGSVKTVINITSDKCYKNNESIYGYRETDPLGGSDPYSSSKSCAEIVSSMYRHSFLDNPGLNQSNLALSSVRAGNVIGGGDWAENRLVPDCIKALSQKMPVVLRCPRAIRPWQHVLEPLSGYLWLGALMQDDQEYSGDWNFGPVNHETYTVENIIREIIDLWGEGKYSYYNNYNYKESHCLKLDISKASGLLGWKPVYSTRKAVKETVNWYRAFYKQNADMYKFSFKQLAEYVDESRKNKLVWAEEQGIREKIRSFKTSPIKKNERISAYDRA